MITCLIKSDLILSHGELCLAFPLITFITNFSDKKYLNHHSLPTRTTDSHTSTQLMKGDLAMAMGGGGSSNNPSTKLFSREELRQLFTLSTPLSCH